VLGRVSYMHLARHRKAWNLRQGARRRAPLGLGSGTVTLRVAFRGAKGDYPYHYLGLSSLDRPGRRPAQ